MFFPFSMATTRAHGSFVPFILPLQDDGHVSVSEDLLSLRFNLQIGSMYLEQEMYSTDGEVYETILVQKNRTKVGFRWNLGPGSYRVIGLSESQMQASTVILTNESGTSTVQIPSTAHVKVEPIDDRVFVLSDSEDDICTSVDLSNTSPFPFKSVPTTRSTVEYKVCRSTPVCIALCHTRILYIHSTSVGMSRACIHIGVYDHYVANGTCRESLDMAYQCVAHKVLKTPTAKNSVMAASK
jgi:hypothetical protein